MESTDTGNPPTQHQFDLPLPEGATLYPISQISYCPYFERDINIEECEHCPMLKKADCPYEELTLEE
jgi:hypothetical protein